MPPKLASFELATITDFCGLSYACDFYEDCGKNASMDRWRVNFYYKPGFAALKFFNSENAKNKFLLELNPIEGDYQVWCDEFNAKRK